MDWAPICNYTHYSLLKGFSKPAELAKKCSENGYKFCGITDYKSISGAISFYKACRANEIQPIIGCAFDKFSLIARNKNGWFDLISIVSSIDKGGDPDKSLLSKVCSAGNLICIADSQSDSPVKKEMTFIKDASLRDIFYTNREDAELHRILICSSLKTTLPKIHKKLKNNEADSVKKFFDRSDYHLPDSLELAESICSESLSTDKVSKIISLCEDYEILSKPSLPKFPCKQSEEEELKQLCREGWKKRLIDGDKVSTEEAKQQYLERFEKEFLVIDQANLFGYFLIVQDIVNYVKARGWLSGPGRGSAAGCLISYMIGITEIDPIELKLLFERFYNIGRNTEEHVSLPDIDVDVPGNMRDEIISYLKEKYGHGNVSQMITFGRLQGRSALKEVLRVTNACSFSEMNEMTKSIPNEADISDQLEEMDEEDRSIIRWSLINNPEELRDFCYINDSGYLALPGLPR